MMSFCTFGKDKKVCCEFVGPFFTFTGRQISLHKFYFILHGSFLETGLLLHP
jgi:hypothetical protein